MAMVMVVSNQNGGSMRLYLSEVGGRICINTNLGDGQNAEKVLKRLDAALTEESDISYFGSDGHERTRETMLSSVDELEKVLQRYGFAILTKRPISV